MNFSLISPQLRAAAAVTAIFLLGVFSGVLGGVRLAEWKIRSFIVQGPEGVAAALGDRIAHKIGLDNDQRAQLSTILVAKTREIQGVRSKVQPEIAAIVRSGESEVRAMLTPEQQNRFTRMTSRLIERWLPLQPPAPAQGVTP